MRSLLIALALVFLQAAPSSPLQLSASPSGLAHGTESCGRGLRGAMGLQGSCEGGRPGAGMAGESVSLDAARVRGWGECGLARAGRGGGAGGGAVARLRGGEDSEEDEESEGEERNLEEIVRDFLDVLRAFPSLLFLLDLVLFFVHPWLPLYFHGAWLGTMLIARGIRALGITELAPEKKEDDEEDD